MTETRIIDSSDVPQPNGAESDLTVVEFAKLNASLHQTIREFGDFYDNPVNYQDRAQGSIGSMVFNKLNWATQSLSDSELDSPAEIPLFWGVRSRDIDSGAHSNHRLVERLYRDLSAMAGNSPLFTHNYYGLESLTRELLERGDSVGQFDEQRFSVEDIQAITSPDNNRIGLQFKVSSHVYVEFLAPGLGPHKDLNGMSEVNLYIVPEYGRVIPTQVPHKPDIERP